MSFIFKDIASKNIPPAPLLPWLTYEQSLTKRLKNITSEAPKLTVLKQHWCYADWWDKNVIGLKERESVIHREITISAKDKKCWYGRTIIPGSTYQSNEALFIRLNQENLGQLIFGNKSITRLYHKFYAITPETIEYYWLKSLNYKDDILWARLAVFSINNSAQFYLIEILLPDLLRVTNELV
ncbi:4-hydroxybenzoate synthetase [Legionella busanensis]|uniref:4-hydroxybenzoate synthetase n=1 Tax=Legionella busanensis TaxID=190655 RepID=A0A378JJL4_9GAMM|nr:chorismate lyase [Legionella busanensis]STX51364.1 4-hydroxybenzoate synthetase [Legionella busanensis]